MRLLYKPLHAHHRKEINLSPALLDMSEYAAPYNKIEGFENLDMRNVFNTLLTITPPPPSGRRTSSKSGSGGSGACPPNPGQTPLSISESGRSDEPTSFLKTMLIHQRDATKALMNTAKRIGPATQKVVQMEDAYSTAFENDLQADLPDVGGTLQGFVLVFFIVSYCALSLVSSIMTYVVYGSIKNALGIFTAFILAGMIITSLLARL